MQNSGIYKITNKSNGKVYIGQSKNMDTRWKSHVNSLKRNKHKNSYLQRAWNQYGEDSFCFDILETIEIKPVKGVSDELGEREKYWADIYDCNNPNKGYNLAQCGGNGTDNFAWMTEEERVEYGKRVWATRKFNRDNPEVPLKIKLSKIGKNGASYEYRVLNTINREIEKLEVDKIKIFKSELLHISNTKNYSDKMILFALILESKLFLDGIFSFTGKEFYDRDVVKGRTTIKAGITKAIDSGVINKLNQENEHNFINIFQYNYVSNIDEEYVEIDIDYFNEHNYVDMFRIAYEKLFIKKELRKMFSRATFDRIFKI